MEVLNMYHEPSNIEKMVNELIAQCYHTIKDWYLWAQLDQSLAEHPDVYKKASAFFLEASRALLASTIQGFCCLFDNDTRTISFHQFEDDLTAFKNTVDDKRCKRVREAYKILDEIRDQHISHIDMDRKKVKFVSDDINVIKNYALDFIDYLGNKYLGCPNVSVQMVPQGMCDLHTLIEFIDNYRRYYNVMQ